MDGLREPYPRGAPDGETLPMRRFMQALFADEAAAQAAQSGQAILAARSLRLTGEQRR